MNRLAGRAVLATAILIAYASAFARSVHAPTAKYVPGVVYVKLNADGARQYAAGTSLAALCPPRALPSSLQAQQAFTGHDMSRYATPAEALSARLPMADDDLSRILVVRYGGGADPRTVSAAFAHSPFVEYSEPLPVRTVAMVPNDSLVTQQWHLQKIDAFHAWDYEEGDSNVVIAVVDNGVDYTHPDLAANIWHNPGEMGLDAQGHDKRTNGIDDDGDGYIDDWQGWDFAGSTAGDPQDNDPSGGNHGIHVAGIAAAVTNNTIGVAGIAHKCRIMVVKTAYDNDPGSLPFGFQGIVYAADRGAKIINCSWGGSTSSSTEQAVINYAHKKGALVIAAAGNAVSDDPFFPASYDHVMSVAGSNSGDIGDGFYSNWGPRIDVLAPGTNILSTYVGDSYQEETGTSMASPCAAGVAALVASHFPNYTNDQIAARVRITGDDVDSNMYYSFRQKFGRSRVNAYHAVHDTGVKSVTVDTVYVTGDDNGNGSLEPGETGTIRIRFKNLLDPTVALATRLSDTVYGPQSNVTVTAPNAFIGTLNTFDTVTSPSSAFVVHVAPNCPQNYKLWFRVDLNDGAYHDYRQFYLYVNPTFVTMDANNIACTVNSRGNQAYNDFATNHQGVGLTYKGGESLLFEGGLIIATDSTHVEDVVRGSDPQGGQDTSFVMDQRVAFTTSPLGNLAQETVGRFTDAGADSASRLHLIVDQHNYEFNTPGNQDYIIVSYKVTNNGPKPLMHLYAGLYMDWDIGASGDSNEVTWDAGGQLGYVRKVNDNTYPVCASATLSSQPATYEALDNNNTNLPPIAVNDGYLPEEKFASIAGLQHRTTSSIADVSNTVGAGPVNIAPGQSETFAFMLAAGPDLTALRTAAANARQMWGLIAAGTSNRRSVFLPNILSIGSMDTVVANAAHNTGNAAVDASVALAGAGASQFALVSPATVHLAAGESADVTLRFTPVRSGLASCLLVVNYGASADTINVFASSSLPVIMMPSLYENQSADSAIAGAFVNRGGATATAYAAIVGPDSGDFRVSPDSAVLAAGQRANCTITFAPDVAGDKTALLLVTVGTHVDSLYIFGTAKSYGILAAADTLVFDSTQIGYETYRSISILNTRADSVTVPFTITGIDSASFRVQSGIDNPVVIPPGGVTFGIFFGPKHQYTNTATITFQPPIGRLVHVVLTGKGGPQSGVADGLVPTSGALAVVPNPVRDAAHVTWSGTSMLRGLTVFDLLGRELARLTPDAHGEFLLDASTLPPGTYLLRSASGITERFVVTK